ncbi:gamma glutamyl transpeptidase, putative [Ixodes scapularis]|uniref:Gamma glutamyl transpeptidase, putative n=1 Tax=Ixodes scapularis TaxID=6945 RepID=B7QDH6_IXOSC|nr:gamma glutamyl transpeptidase, putative [Ixodes scapularis]|eukprot:XP_002413590.1 gamma glutamyl transpeptidase, putative [Ixodes scapularis]
MKVHNFFVCLNIKKVSSTQMSACRFKTRTLHTFSGYDKTSGEYFHLLMEALRLAIADGLSCLSSPDPSSLTSVHQMNCKKHAEDRRALIDKTRAMNEVVAADLLVAPQSHTTFLSTVDEHGNACSFIGSNFNTFGCNIVEQHGFAVHNRAMGFVGVEGHPNCIGPLKKPYHTLMPVMVADSYSGEWMANIGSMGGYLQPQIVLQVLLGMMELGLNPQEAVDRPRVTIGSGSSVHPDAGLTLEEGLSPEVIQGLEEKSHRFRGTIRGVNRRNMGSVHVTTRGSWWTRVRGPGSYAEGDDVFLWFGSDPRWDGAAMAY